MRILFVGNSFTARNNLPGLLKGLAGARGIDLEHKLISAGGASLRQHLNAGKALEAIATGDFDTVVLQEQSTLPIKSPARFREGARDFHTAISAAGVPDRPLPDLGEAERPRDPTGPHRRVRR